MEERVTPHVEEYCWNCKHFTHIENYQWCKQWQADVATYDYCSRFKLRGQSNHAHD